MLLVVDCGASSTKIAVYNSEFNLIHFNEQNSIAYSILDQTSFLEETLSIVERTSANQKYICIASAGLSDKKVQASIQQNLSIKLNQKVFICSDADLALWNSIEGKNGLVLILGTGSIFLGRSKNNNSFRYGGHGYLYDSISGAYALVRNYFSELLKHEDNSTAKSEIAFFCEAANISALAEMLRKSYKVENPAEYVASYAKIVLRIAEAEIASVARQEVLRYAKKISDKSTIIIQKEKLEHKQLHITGGLLKNEFLKRLLKEALNEAAIELIYEERENTYGACEMLKAGVF